MKQSCFLVAGFLFTFIILSMQVSAIGLQYYGIESSLNEDLSVNTAITLQFDTPITHLDYNLAFEISNLTAKGDFGPVFCSSKVQDSRSMISCDFSGMTRKKNKIILNFDSKESISMQAGDFLYSVNYGIPLSIERAFVLLKLPEKGVLAREIANQSYFPADGTVITDGKKIMVYWEKYNLTKDNDLRFSLMYNLPRLREPFFNFVIIALTVIIIVAMALIAIYIRRGRTKTTTEVVTSVLSKDEKTIVDILNKYEGKTFQKNLVRDSGFSKAKVSRLLKSLNERNVIDIEPISGRENRIVLKIKST